MTEDSVPMTQVLLKARKHSAPATLTVLMTFPNLSSPVIGTVSKQCNACNTGLRHSPQAFPASFLSDCHMAKGDTGNKDKRTSMKGKSDN